MPFRFDHEGWLVDGGEIIVSPHFDERPDGMPVDLVVMHNISLPAGVYGSGHIEALFQGRLDISAHESFADLAGLRVSSHFLVRRDGSVVQFVSLLKRAWHAGVSEFQGRTACNDFSVGVELEGCDADHFTDAQMTQSVALIGAVQTSVHALQWVAGHSDIAPGRKTDPGPHFPWAEFLGGLERSQCSLTRPFSDLA
jgi:N-acetyl-anhydromuramoyl-L-alanine amidase